MVPIASNASVCGHSSARLAPLEENAQKDIERITPRNSGYSRVGAIEKDLHRRCGAPRIFPCEAARNDKCQRRLP